MRKRWMEQQGFEINRELMLEWIAISWGEVK
jgi:hypothetical protein